MAVIQPGAVDAGQVDSAISACEADNPCEAAWQTSYVYAADQAYRLAIFQALQGIVFGALQYASADRAADLQYDIADRQMRIAEEEYQRYKDNYVECEDALAAEICALVLPPIDYDTRADRATRDVRREYSLLRRNLTRTRARYCLSDQMREYCDLEKAEALAVVQARDITYRYAEAYQDVLDERRWTRRMAVVTMGRNIMSGQSSDYQSGMQGASMAIQARQDAFSLLLGQISGGIGAIANARSVRNNARFTYSGYMPGATRANPGQYGGQSFIHSGIPSPASITMGGGMQSGVRV